MKTQDGRIYCLAGASRSVKTLFASQVIGTAPRVFAWDIEAQWCKLPGWRRISNRADLARAADTPGAALVAFVPPAGADPRELFGFWSRCMFHTVDTHGAAWIIGEELADVTTTAKAPGYWGALIRRGMKRGASIVAISQRWSEADKTCLGNCSELVAFVQASDKDARYIADATRIPLPLLRDLTAEYWTPERPRRLPFVRYDTRTKTPTLGAFEFSKAGKLIKQA